MIKDLETIGFKPVGSWSASSSGIELSLHSLADASPALYAFLVEDEVMYVGKTKQTLLQRLKFYRKPGKSQRTNIRVRKEIIEALRTIENVAILGFHDAQPKFVGKFRLNMAAGLEEDIIAQINPPWNGGRKPIYYSKSELVTEVQELPEKRDQNTLSRGSDSSSCPSFTVKIGKTYFRQGFFNVPINYESYFAEHGADISIITPDRSTVIYGHINRTVNSNCTPRIMGTARLRDWFQSHVKLGDLIRIIVHGPNRIELSED